MNVAYAEKQRKSSRVTEENSEYLKVETSGTYSDEIA